MNRTFIFTAVILIFLAFGLTAGSAAGTTIRIYYEDNAQFELVGSDGRRILIDVYDPSLLSSPATSDDILLTTHPHWDHLNPAFFNTFPGRRFSTPGELTVDGIRIRGVLTSHFSIPEQPIAKAHRNISYVIDWNGLRILHFGDNQQLLLTEPQLRAIGRVDIAMASLIYDPSGVIDPGGFGPLAQVRPKLVIPTHMNQYSGRHGLELWTGFRTEKSFVTVEAEDLTGGTRVLLMGKNARLFGELPIWEASN